MLMKKDIRQLTNIILLDNWASNFFYLFNYKKMNQNRGAMCKVKLARNQENGYH